MLLGSTIDMLSKLLSKNVMIKETPSIARLRLKMTDTWVRETSADEIGAKAMAVPIL